MWALSERQNLSPIPSTMIDHAVLAQKYFGEAYRLNPADTRILAFLASTKFIVGSISQDEKLITNGYFDGLKGIREWNDFTEFSLAYSFSGLPHTDPNFQKALNWMESTANRCYCEDFDPQSERCIQNISQKVDNLKSIGKKRIVYNSWIAPHNIEGFFMFWGDLLVKHGEWEKAIPVYEFAKHAPDYPNWDYQKILENRIKNAQRNVNLFRTEWPKGQKIPIDNAVMKNTAISCRGCHQMSKADRLLTYKNFNTKAYLDKSFYFLNE